MADAVIFAKRARTAENHYRRCLLCERRCGVDRSAGNQGFCQATTEARVWRYWIDFAEEPAITPSLLIYLSGCDLRCAYCISAEQGGNPRLGKPLTNELAQAMLDEGIAGGAKYVEWLGGEANIHLPAILQVMAECRRTLPMAWKSNFYGTPETWSLLNGLAEVYIADFKFGNDGCAKRLADAERYFEIVSRNLLLVAQQGRLFVRHLALPGHFECCSRPIVAWMAKHLPDTPFRVLTSYLPRWKASDFAEIARPLNREEADATVDLAKSHKLILI